jgi:hypothetical protein
MCRPRFPDLQPVNQPAFNLRTKFYLGLRQRPSARGITIMATERRKGERITFERGIAAHMMGIDGTWRRDCTMEDISETGAKLTVEGSVEGLHLKEFFLLLSSTGLAYRRCELAWVNGDQMGVNFLKPADKKKKAARRPNPATADV